MRELFEKKRHQATYFPLKESEYRILAQHMKGKSVRELAEFFQLSENRIGQLLSKAQAKLLVDYEAFFNTKGIFVAGEENYFWLDGLKWKVSTEWTDHLYEVRLFRLTPSEAPVDIAYWQQELSDYLYRELESIKKYRMLLVTGTFSIRIQIML